MKSLDREKAYPGRALHRRDAESAETTQRKSSARPQRSLRLCGGVASVYRLSVCQGGISNARCVTSVNNRTDVVGSLLRPAYLKEARAAYEAGNLTDQAFKQIEDRAVGEAIALQERAGLAVITDGELRRYAFYGHLIDAV